ncbi:MAG: hypothetical protein ACON5B_10855 [Myxococcota bacterium]
MSEIEPTPIPAHLASEFYAWLWWRSDEVSDVFDLGSDLGSVTLWVDSRLAFRLPGDNKATAVMTGENPNASLESRAALAGGKVLQELRVGIRRDDREFTATLRGPELHITGLKVPQVLSESEQEAVMDRMFAYDELALVVGALFSSFADARVRPAYESEVLGPMNAWLLGGG